MFQLMGPRTSLSHVPIFFKNIFLFSSIERKKKKRKIHIDLGSTLPRRAMSVSLRNSSFFELGIVLRHQDLVIGVPTTLCLFLGQNY